MLLAGGTVIFRADALDADIVTVVNPESVNAVGSILVTELGIVIDVNLEH
jgi:hypothetical protein